MTIPYNCYLIDPETGNPTADLSRGELFISVSSVLKQEGKDLIPWALKTFGPEDEPLSAYKAFMDKVSDLGSRIHRYVEMDLKGKPLEASDVQEDMLPAIDEWEKFRRANQVQMLASERVLSSLKWRCAGTCDAVVRLNGKLFVADIKTGSVYPQAFTQMAAYKAMLCQEKGRKRIKGIETADLLIINLHRDGKKVELHTLASYYKGRVTIQDEIGVFHCLRFIWFHRNAKSRQFEPVVKNMREIFSPLEKKFKEAFQL